ncbi:hypothetical protein BDR06DRAFT_1009624 [Suillus hirtellus]|nr:hypothetical protein BDR06DRAFT_1009624 [Suillus hirtellus]
MVVKAENSPWSVFDGSRKSPTNREARSDIQTLVEMIISVLMVFALAMVSYPNVQKPAQVEIDSVVGRDRSPTFEDRASLPYVESVLRETLR